MKNPQNEEKMAGMFEFLKGLNVKGISSFSSYEQFKNAKVEKNNQTMYVPGQVKVPEPMKYTEVQGSSGFAIQHTLAEQEEFFDSLNTEERAEFQRAFDSEKE